MNSKLSSADGRSRWRRRPRLFPGSPSPCAAPGSPGAGSTSSSRSAAGQALLAALVDVGRRQPVAQAALADADVGGDLGDRLGSLTGQLDGTASELRRMRRWHTDSFPEVLPPQRRCPANRGMLIGHPQAYLNQNDSVLALLGHQRESGSTSAGPATDGIQGGHPAGCRHPDRLAGRQGVVQALTVPAFGVGNRTLHPIWWSAIEHA